VTILSLQGVRLILANQCLLDQVDWQIKHQDRVALVGRNGAGKSTLLKLLQGELTVDGGQINRISGLRIAGLAQDVPISVTESVYHFLVKSLGELGELLTNMHEVSASGNLEKLAHYQQKMDDFNAWELIPRVEMMASRLSIDPNALMSQLSGGMKRRVLLAAALIAAPDLLLLDEPTNHLDIASIEWLESYLKNYSGTVVVVTHDRSFLSAVASSIIEIDRGKLYRHDCDYETYLDRREAIRLTEQKEHALFDKRLSEEEAWLRTGVKARRTRNEGRVRALEAMRLAHQRRRVEVGKIAKVALDVSRSGQLVIEAQDVTYSLGAKCLVRDFSLLLTRGDKLGIIGPNGCGKTTLVRLLLGELSANKGQIRQGTALNVAYFDQLRDALDEQQTVMANVADGADYVTVNGHQKHVATYLREFLFPPERFNQPVSSLSGGERTRLLLAKLFAYPVNLLVMDEPTNDLDIESLELLETMLIDYPGTLILISHDRAFINQVVTSVLVYEGDGCFNEFVGGYEDYRRYKKQLKAPPVTAPSVPQKKAVLKRSSQDQRELTALLEKIDGLEKHIETLHLEMTTPAFYQQEADKISAFQKSLALEEARLKEMYERWELLDGKHVG